MPGRTGNRLPKPVAVTALALALASGCGGEAAHDCTLIGTAVGIAIDVRHPGVGDVAIEVCRDGSCATPVVVLHPSDRVGETTCSGTAPDDTCGARSEPTGERSGFAQVPDLPAEPVRVRLSLTDRSGSPLPAREIVVTPEMAYPNGPNCPAGGPQARISLGPDGSVTER
ncbi:hypothetical protein [Saccharothrix lopnurensis]|uniref:hypothetical protein n=1 Tax=Saccharothrix lopnurensis TaxID=1670621 RepID=UPI0036D334F0